MACIWGAGRLTVIVSGLASFKVFGIFLFGVRMITDVFWQIHDRIVFLNIFRNLMFFVGLWTQWQFWFATAYILLYGNFYLSCGLLIYFQDFP